MEEIKELVISAKEIQAVIFDMDGVVTDTATLHLAAWERLFNEFLNAYPEKKRFEPADYYAHLNGVARIDGIKNFIASRALKLPEGNLNDKAEVLSVAGLGVKKNQIFQELLKEKKAEIFEDTINIIKKLRNKGIKTALISASKNAETIIKKAGIDNLFEIMADGNLTEREKINGKPAPDIFLYAANKLGVHPSQAAVAEDAMSGVKAAKQGNFHLVIGVDREGKDELLFNAGADIVVNSFNEIKITE